MFESRCGVCCNSCERKEKVNCTGCVNMEKPFWGGECQVKVCCEKVNIITVVNVAASHAICYQKWEKNLAIIRSPD